MKMTTKGQINDHNNKYNNEDDYNKYNDNKDALGITSNDLTMTKTSITKVIATIKTTMASSQCTQH